MQEILMTMDPYESAFFYLVNDFKRAKLIKFIQKHGIQIKNPNDHLIVHITVTACDGYSQFENNLRSICEHQMERTKEIGN